jgi:hypothetical protein
MAGPAPCTSFRSTTGEIYFLAAFRTLSRMAMTPV